MKNCILILLAFLISTGIARSQEEDIVKTPEVTKQKYFLGGYYTFMVEPYILESTGDSVNFTQHFLNINLRYALNHKWRFGIESIFSVVPFEGVDDPFYTIGVTADYDILRTKKSKLHARVGISFGNLL